MKKNGFTLLELTIAMTLTSVMLVGAINLTAHVARVNARVTTRQELFHHATISMEFLTVHINEAMAINLVTESNNTLDHIEFFNEHVLDENQNRIINYRPITYPNNRLMFGGNRTAPGTQEIARYIANVEVSHNTNEQLLFITITTEPSITRFDILIEPIVLRTAINVQHKIMLP